MDYNKQAQDFLDMCGMTFIAQKDEVQTPAPWCSDSQESGNKYLIILKKDASELRFAFWGSIADKKNGVHPSAYDVLACISGDAQCCDDFKSWCSDMGYDTDSRRAHASWKGVMKFRKRLVAFFTPEEIEALQEIQ